MFTKKSHIAFFPNPITTYLYIFEPDLIINTQVMLPLKTMCLNYYPMNVVIVIALMDILQKRVHLLTVMTVAIPQTMKMKVMASQVKIIIYLFELSMSY